MHKIYMKCTHIFKSNAQLTSKFYDTCSQQVHHAKINVYTQLYVHCT